MTNTAPIVKNTIYAGQKYVPIADGSKVHFHFQTWKLGKEKVLIDDSKKIGKREPMVLVIGHKFKLEVWENIVKKMAVGEVASFQVKKELCKLVYSYPFVSKTLRELGQEQRRKHTCTMTLHTEGIGYPDLDDLINNPCDLEFIIEVLKVETSNEYEKELWQLSSEERLKLVPELKEKGNKLYGQKLYDEAEDAYRQAIAICEQLMIRERKCDEEWISLNKIKLPILLNFAQCKLIKGEYYDVIEHCNTVLDYDAEVLKVETSNEYEKELWQLSSEERLKLVPELKEKGNKLYGQKLYDEAEDAYRQAIAICEQLMIRERKCDEEWISLNKIKLPILLNFAQCKLIKGEYYDVIEHCNTVLDYDADNEKALYRRAKANVGAWNPDAAEKDFKRLKTLNPDLIPTIDKELENIKQLRKQKSEKDKETLKKLFVKENESS